MPKKNFSLLLVILLTFGSFNCALVRANSSNLTLKEKEIIKSVELNYDQISFHLIELKHRNVLRSHRSSAPMIPASLTKVPTTFMALKTLGADKTFDTSLYYKGEIKEDILIGDLYLKGEGDPAFSKRELFNLALHLNNLGIKEIKGKFLFDDSSIPHIKKLSTIGLGDQTYNPSINALPLDFNQFVLFKAPETEDHKPVPALEMFNIQMTADEFTPGRRFRNSSSNDLESWQLSESVNYRSVERMPLRNSSIFTASLFKKFANELGIKLPKASRGIIPEEAKLLSTQSSQSVLKLVEANLEYSNNLLAELLLFHSIKKQGYELVDLESSAKLMTKWYLEEYPNTGWERAAFINGSGLTSKNRLSAYSLSSLLSNIQKEKFSNRFYWSLFPMAGRTSWLKRRLNKEDHLFRVWTKTGSLDYVNNLTGYFISKSGKKVAFTILINDKKKRFLVDGPNSQEVEQLRVEAKSWAKSAYKVQDELLEYWIQNY